MFDFEMTIAVTRQRQIDLLLEAEQERLMAKATQQRSGISGKFLQVAAWIGLKLVRRGTKPEKPSTATQLRPHQRRSSQS